MATTAGYSQKPDSIVKGQSVSTQPQTSNACVLVVEDHEDTRFMLRTLLELRGGISVVEAENGESAIALAESMHPDLILMDTDLPLLDGYAATRRIRQLTSAREVPIVFLSGHAQPVAQARAFAAGCTDYLVKPFALGEMDRLIERHLSQRKAIS
jgi:CheY-like chemotaxis protein